MFDHLIALALFAFVSTFTPGPNNMMLMTSGANIGVSRTVPHILGVALGFGLMVFLVGIGAQQLFSQFPMLHQVLNVVCIGFLFYLALKIAMSKPSADSHRFKPMTFFSAALFQWVNPKGWSMALTAVSLYNPEASVLGLILITVIFISINIPSCTTWAFAGKRISKLLKNTAHIRTFNVVMALLLVGSTLPMLM
jgi:threonine/homoserine/homoserine lactone efflux protein